MKEKQNVLVIISDQLRRDALGVYGDPNISTPNIDALANSGACFTNACSTYPLCIPFRYSLMTGEYAHTPMIPALGWRMSPSERTLADEFNESDYETAYIGKWHLYGGQINVEGFSALEENSKPIPRSHQGRWSYWRGFDLRNGPFDTNYYVDDDPTPHKIDGYQTDGLTDLAIDFIENQRDDSKPFCTVLSVEPPHPPFEAPKELEEKWLNSNIKLPPNFMKEPEDSHKVTNGTSPVDPNNEQASPLLNQRKLYYAMVENFDANVGRIVQCLKDAGLYDNTYIALVADHGELGGSHNSVSKQYPYEESIGIPLIISGPDISPEQLEAPLCTEDLFPTILGLAGITPKNNAPGMDLSSWIKGDTKEPERPGVLLEFVWEPRPTMVFFGQIWRGFRSKRYKYTVLGNFEDALKPWQFFDLENDPYELDNLIDDKDSQILISKHHEWMKSRMIEVGDDEARLMK